MKPLPPPDRLHKWAGVTPILIFAVYVALVLIVQRHLLFGPFLLPDIDNAADDLLVSEALRGHLLHGNYSRVGFNHPGPWFQYVAAAGELVFYRWTHLFSSYLAGQEFAVSLTQGVALALAGRLALLVSQQVSMAVVAVLVIAATIAAPLGGIDPFVAFWNPYSYIAAGLLTATGLAGVMLRGPSWLPLLVLGCAQLVHGHASFVGLVPMMLLVAGLLGLAMGRLPFRPWRLRPAAAWCRANPAPVLLSLVIAAVFAAPLVLDTMLHWPGQFPAYFRFAGSTAPNGILPAALYLLAFIPGAGLWLLLLLVPAGASESARDLRAAAIVVLVAGVLPAFWYAWRGIDDLRERYLLLWLTPFAGVALAVTLAFWQRATPFAAVSRAAIGLVASAIAIGVLWQMTPWQPAVANNQDIQRALATVLASPRPQGRSSLFLSPIRGIGVPVWVETASLMAALKRAGRDDFCIDPQSWHVLFTPALRCDPGHETILRALQVTAKAIATGTPVLALHDDVIETRAPVRAPPPLELEKALAAGLRIGRGWAAREDWGVWTLGPQATLSLDASGLPARFTVTLTGRLFGRLDQLQTVTVAQADGPVLGVLAGRPGPGTVTVTVTNAGKADRVDIILRIAHPTRPMDVDSGQDDRPLGFGLTSVQISD